MQIELPARVPSLGRRLCQAGQRESEVHKKSASADWPLRRDPGYAVGVITEQHCRGAIDRARIASRTAGTGQSGNVVEVRVQFADEVEAEIRAGECFRADGHPARGQLHLGTNAPPITRQLYPTRERGSTLECRRYILRTH